LALDVYEVVKQRLNDRKTLQKEELPVKRQG
jgi:hypothetical protein